MKETITIEFDGGSRGNPGPAGIGVVLRSEDGTALLTLGKYLGVATNNVAEYRGLITGLEEAKKLGAKNLIIRGDSELIIKQMRGEYAVKNANLRDLYAIAHELAGQFGQVKFEHNYRHKNQTADRLANLAMDRKGVVTDVDEEPIETPAAVETKKGDRFVCRRCGMVVEVVETSRVRAHQLKELGCQCGNRMTSE